MCGGGGAVPQAPDTTAQSGASNKIGDTTQQAGADQLNWAKGQVANNTATTQNVQGQLSPLIGQQAGAGSAASQQFQNQTLGGLNQQLQTAQDYGSPAGQAQASAAAMAQTGQAYNAARMNNQRQLGSYGVDPSTMKSGALNLNSNLAQAGAVGNAGYNAGQQRQLTGMGLTSQALGQNLQAAGVGQGYTAGANATGSNIVGLGNQTTATGSSALSAPSQMFGTALSGYGQSANIQNQNFQNQMSSYNAQQQSSNGLMGGIGQLAGGVLKAYTGGLADGGAIPGRRPVMRFADGGPSAPISSMVPVQGIPAIQQGYVQPQGQTGMQSLASGFDQGVQMGGDAAKAYAAYKVNTPQTQQQRQDLSRQGTDAAQALGGMPDYQFADGGIPQRKKLGFDNPGGYGTSGVPPQVGIPGPWVAANGGSTPGPGFIDPSNGPSDGTGIDDQVPAKVSVGEYIVPADVVHAKGKEFFDKLLQRYHTPAQVQRQQMGIPQRSMH